MRERELLIKGLSELPLSFGDEEIEKLLRFSDMLLEKNRVMNLTAVENTEEVVTRHFLDCSPLAVFIGQDVQSSNIKVIDVGTGAGFPGIPLAVLLPRADIVLLDAQMKRVNFLRDVIGKLELTHCEAVHARAEDYARVHRGEFDFAVSRAVAELRVLCELSLPMVRTGGSFLAMKAAGCEDEVKTSAHASEVLGGTKPEVLWYSVPIVGTRRAVVRIGKAHDTTERYPRRYKKIDSEPL